MLRVDREPLRATFQTPEDLPSGRCINVTNGRLVETKPEGHTVRLISTDKSFSLFWDESPLLIATTLELELIHLKLDFRSLGIAIHDDIDGLHIGSNVFALNEVRKSAIGINLA